jgi:hypothetical protein
MLQPEPFRGDQAALIMAASRFWADFSAAIKDVAPAIKGNLDEIEKQREVRFLDTATHLLRRNDYVLRERTDGGTRTSTLKFRHPCRYYSSDRDLKAAEAKQAKTKFEEDIKPPHQSLFSFFLPAAPDR